MAYADLYAELNKLKKDQLIEIIISKKLPDNVSSSEHLKVHLIGGITVENNENSRVEGFHNPSDSVSLIEVKCDLRVTRAELDCSRKIVAELERVIEHQREIIHLLKVNKNTKEKSSKQLNGKVAGLQRNSSETTERNASEVNGSKTGNDVAVGSRGNSTTSKSVDIGSQNVILEENHESCHSMGWQKVPVRKKQRNVTHGTNTTITNTKLQAVPKKAFLFVSRFAPETEAEDVVSFLKAKFPEVQCEKLESRYAEHYSCFKVTIHLSNLENASKPESWPSGIYVSRFFRPRVNRQKLA